VRLPICDESRGTSRGLPESSRKLLPKKLDDAIDGTHDDSGLKEQKQDEDAKKADDNLECPVGRYPHWEKS
jgi:hypothetical protein